MSSINLYKIDTSKSSFLLAKLNQEMSFVGTKIINSTFLKKRTSYGFSLYLACNNDEKAVPWQWVLNEFEQDVIKKISMPKAVVLVEVDDYIYAFTFGNSYFLVDRYCDREFGFDFARKQLLLEVKTTALIAPSSRRNKIVNTYINYDELEFDSGESFAKIKAKADLNEGFSLFKPAIEMGSSIRFSTDRTALTSLAKIIDYVEDVIQNGEEHYKIPVFSPVVDKELIADLDSSLQANIVDNPDNINISELDIVGVTEVFNTNDGEYVLHYKRKQKNISQLTAIEIRNFCNEYGFDYNSSVLSIKVESLKDGETISSDTIYSLVDYTDDTRRCLLTKGKWYRYNDDYLSYLNDSLAEIQVIYNSQYDFSKHDINDFIKQKYEENKDNPDYVGKTSNQVFDILRKKYYRECIFNLKKEADGFQNKDRKIQPYKGNRYEVADLYKDNTIFATKIGNSSSKLCYAVDQSLTALKMYKHRTEEDLPEISKVVLWLVLERKKKLPLINGKPDITQLEMLMLKNRIDQWKKEVRLQGFIPEIWINYFH